MINIVMLRGHVAFKCKTDEFYSLLEGTRKVQNIIYEGGS